MAAPQASVVPVLGRRVLESLLGSKAKYFPRYRLVLVYGRYSPEAPRKFTTVLRGDGREQQLTVDVAEEHSVLGITDAWHRHRDAGTGYLLVVFTERGEGELSWDLLGHAAGNRIFDPNRAEIIMHRFGAAQLDTRLQTEQLLTALLEAEPVGGWPRIGGLLTHDAAMQCLVAARLGLGEPEGSGASVPDADAVLAWSRSASGPRRFAELAEKERTEITEWLVEVAGSAVRPLLALAAAGRGHDAMSLGMVASVLHDSAAPAEAAVAIGALFGAKASLADLRPFSQAVQGTIARWLAAPGANGRQPHHTDPREHAVKILRRADELAGEAGLTTALSSSIYLPSSFDARLRDLAAALDRTPAATEQALVRLGEHQLAAVASWSAQVRTAEAAVRLARWGADPTTMPGSVADAVSRHLTDWGWVDAALTVLWAGAPEPDGAVAAAYGSVYDRARQRRTELDSAFAQLLAPWVRSASTLAPGGCFLVEQVLAEVAAPLRGKDSAPLVLVLDAMSSAVALQLAGELSGREGWLEAVRSPGVRDAAVAAMPSVTRISRTSLLSGRCTAGGQAEEKEGFAAFWAQYRDRGARLFHKVEIPGEAGRRLSPELQEALAGPSAVGAVLNTIDESLDHSPQGDRTGWNLSAITYLEELLAAARNYGRPLVLVADHGHVLERERDSAMSVLDDATGAARWRTGSPADGEVRLSGPRVLEGGGDIVVPWREELHYTRRRGGYHGGAALAEMTVPVLVFLSSNGQLPDGWSVLEPEEAKPAWWDGHRTETQEPVHDGPDEAPDAGVPQDRTVPAQIPAASTPSRTEDTLGKRVVASPVYEGQRLYVRKAPSHKDVAAAIDQLAAAGGTLSTAAVAIAARARPERAAGLVVTLQRLLNVEGYPVLQPIDDGARLRLDTNLARQQFQIEE